MSADQRIVSHAHFKVSPAQSGEGVRPHRGSDRDLESLAPSPRARAERAARAANAALALALADAAIANAQLACTEREPNRSRE